MKKNEQLNCPAHTIGHKTQCHSGTSAIMLLSLEHFRRHCRYPSNPDRQTRFLTEAHQLTATGKSKASTKCRITMWHWAGVRGGAGAA